MMHLIWQLPLLILIGYGAAWLVWVLLIRIVAPKDQYGKIIQRFREIFFIGMFLLLPVIGVMIIALGREPLFERVSQFLCVAALFAGMAVCLVREARRVGRPTNDDES